MDTAAEGGLMAECPRELEEIVAAIRRYAGSRSGIGRNHAESLIREAYQRGRQDASTAAIPDRHCPCPCHSEPCETCGEPCEACQPFAHAAHTATIRKRQKGRA